ncbi:hypothetical protein BKA82DRAFT_4010826 [Pisolithus tinctorius]|nr:hypothetical protein BKA82DRAFT_4010826 [Pisolithus tinctorius]
MLGNRLEIISLVTRMFSQPCRRELRIEWGWGPPCIEDLPASGTSVHRIKVDEDLGLVITTGQRGRFLVTDLEGNTPLCGLLPVSKHFLIFHKVKPLLTAFGNLTLLNTLTANMITGTSYSTDTTIARKFGAVCSMPWALLRMPENTRAFRLSHLTLLASGVENAYLWDASQGRLVETISSIQSRHHRQTLDHIHYEGANDKYAFICDSNQLRMFERSGGARVYDLSPRNLPKEVWNVEEHPPFGSPVVKRQRL